MLNLHEILYHVIFNCLEFYNKHAFRRICKYMNKIHITDLCDIDCVYLVKLDDKNLLDYKFAKKLDARHGRKITNVNHMINLKILDASGDCGINDNGIKNINLEKLYVSYNHKITNVNHMTKLKILDASCGCGIDDDGIEDLNLEYLNAVANPKITSENHMTNLKGSIKYMLNR